MIKCDILIALKCFEPFFKDLTEQNTAGYKLEGMTKPPKKLQVWEKTVFIFVVYVTFLLILNIVP